MEQTLSRKLLLILFFLNVQEFMKIEQAKNKGLASEEVW